MVLPPEFQYGKVTGRVIHAVADSVEDPDALPDARPAAGKVTFAPLETLRVVTTEGHKAFVTRNSQEVTLNAEGALVDAHGDEGVWLIVGTYKVNFNITGATNKLPPLTIEVTADHTDADPLDLTEAVNYVPPVGATVQTLQVPAGFTEGDFLTIGGSGLTWARPTSVLGLAFVHHGGLATVERPDAVTVIWAGTVEPVNADPDYDLWVGPPEGV